MFDTPAPMSPSAQAALDKTRAMLVNRVRIVDPDRIVDDCVTISVGDGRVRVIDETSGLILQLDADRAEEIGRSILSGAVKLRVEAREAAERRARADAAFLQPAHA